MGFPARRLPASASTDAGHASAPTRSNGSSLARASSDSNPTRVAVRHARGCDFRGWDNFPCKCDPGYQAWVSNKRAREGEQKRPRKTFSTPEAAKDWRDDQLHKLRHGGRIASTKKSVAAAADELLAGMRDGTISARGGKRYKPSVIRSYEQDLRNYIRPEFGHRKLSDVEHLDIQDFIDALHGQGLSARRSTTPSTR